jgi:hypothetical protein
MSLQEQRAKKWEPVFCKKRCANKEIEQEADSELTHLALEQRVA